MDDLMSDTSTEQSADSTGERLIAFGGAIKSINGNGLRGSSWNRRRQRERFTTRERFAVDTDYALDLYAERPLPVSSRVR